MATITIQSKKRYLAIASAEARIMLKLDASITCDACTTENNFPGSHCLGIIQSMLIKIHITFGGVEPLGVDLTVHRKVGFATGEFGVISNMIFGPDVMPACPSCYKEW